jgi:hypothetical protein
MSFDLDLNAILNGMLAIKEQGLCGWERLSYTAFKELPSSCADQGFCKDRMINGYYRVFSKTNSNNYTDEPFELSLSDPYSRTTPGFVLRGENGEVGGFAFFRLQQQDFIIFMSLKISSTPMRKDFDDGFDFVRNMLRNFDAKSRVHSRRRSEEYVR